MFFSQHLFAPSRPWVSTKKFRPIGPAVWPAIRNIYTNVLFNYTDILCMSVRLCPMNVWTRLCPNFVWDLTWPQGNIWMLKITKFVSKSFWFLLKVERKYIDLIFLKWNLYLHTTCTSGGGLINTCSFKV